MNCAKCIHYVVCPYDNVMSKAELITNCIHFIDTADTKKVVHGEWTKFNEDDNSYICSCCGFVEWNYVQKKNRFCTYCGAKMDGEQIW